MRREGDLLLQHVGQADDHVILCAPFVKAGVLRRVLLATPAKVRVSVVTRWIAADVAAGVSDLEALDVVAARSGASLALIDALHAKLYVSDGRVLTGSANLTAKALGWCRDPNVEVLTSAAFDSPSVNAVLELAAIARPATKAERDRVAREALRLGAPRSPEAAEDEDELASVWFPRLGDPRRLFPIYARRGLDRMMASTLEAAEHDLAALGVPVGLAEDQFWPAAARAFARMPAVHRLLERVEADLTDEEAESIIASVALSNGMAADQQWLVVREWIAHLLADRIEVAPQSFVTRRRPGSAR